jgi:hypothetical protein
MVVLILLKDFVDFLPIVLKLLPILLDLFDQDSILKLSNLRILPHHGQVGSADDLKVRVVKRLGALHHLVHDINDQGVILGIAMLLEKFRMGVIHNCKFWLPLTDVVFTNNEAKRHVQEGCHRRHVFLRRHADDRLFGKVKAKNTYICLAKGYRIVSSRCENTVFVAPLFECLVSRFCFQFLSSFYIHL